MTLVSSKQVLLKAMRHGYAVGHFNIENLETLKAVIGAAEELDSPVFIAVTDSALRYAGFDYLVPLAKAAARASEVPVVLHLDHGQDISVIKRCLKAGFTSIMCDASFYSFKKNVEITRKVVAMARRVRVPVEAELGSMKKGAEKMLTDPRQARKFVELTGIDSLAVSVGTSHGAYKFSSSPTLDMARLKDIDILVDIPLVLHGASEIPAMVVRKGMQYGARWRGARGLDNRSLREACANGINKVNLNTDTHLCYLANVRQYLKQHPQEVNPRHMNAYAYGEVKELLKRKIMVLGSAGKARRP